MSAKKKRISLSTIAKETGLAVSTVSMALNNNPEIPETTCRRVQEAADRLGYRRSHALSSALRSIRSGKEIEYRETLGVIVGSADYETNYLKLRDMPLQDINNAALRYSGGLCYKARELGFSVDFFNIGEIALEKLPAMLHTRGIKRVIVICCEIVNYYRQQHHQAKDWEQIWSEFICTFVSHAQYDWMKGMVVGTDHFETGRQAFLKAWQNGYRKFYLNPNIINSDSEQRFEAGMRMAAGAHENANTIQYAPLLSANTPEDRQISLAWLNQLDSSCCFVGPIYNTKSIFRERLKKPCPPGIIQMDVNPLDKDHFSGYSQNNFEIATTAVEISSRVASPMKNGNAGKNNKVLVDSDWIEGQHDGGSLPIVRNDHLNLLPDQNFEGAEAEKLETLDIKQHLNDMTGEGKPVAENHHMSSPPPGVWIFHHIPFRIQGKDNLTALRILGQTQDPENRSNMRIQVNKTTKSFYFLHASAVAHNYETIASYRFHYRKHPPEELPLVTYGQNLYGKSHLDDAPPEVNIQDWWPFNGYLTQKQSQAIHIFGDSTRGLTPGYLYVTQWKNPHPRRIVTHIELVPSTDTKALTIVYAITAGR
jgi:DNA-binding LacI/PurR family transcriptional regulator